MKMVSRGSFSSNAAAAQSAASAAVVAAAQPATPLTPPQVLAQRSGNDLPDPVVAPTAIGQCALMEVKEVGARLQGQPGSGSALSYQDGTAQVSYDQVPGMDAAKPGDLVNLCLVSLPQNCPPGDDRGKVYRATDQRTGLSWTAPDSEHSCGGA